MLLDSLARRYDCLPSQIMREADTLDVLVMDIAVSYEAAQRERSEREAALARGELPKADHIPLNTLQEMVNRVKNK